MRWRYLQFRSTAVPRLQFLQMLAVNCEEFVHLRSAAKALQGQKQLICYAETLVFILRTLQADSRAV